MKGGNAIERYSRSPGYYETLDDNGGQVEWRNGDRDSRLLLDVAAGRSLSALDALSQEGFLQAHRHGLVGLLADGPTAIRDRALPSLVRLAARQKVMTEHLQRVLQAFQARGIRATVLKGPHLAEAIYRVAAHRTYTDIDVLVPRDDLSRALEVLSADTAVSSIPAQGPKADKRNIPLVDPSGVRFTLDLHWDLFSYSQLQRAADGATEESWRRATGPETIGYGPSWVLPEAATVAFLCTHALLDHRFRLILFRDLTELAARRPDWDQVARFAERWGLRSTTYVALLMASRITDADVPQGFLSDLRPRTMAIAATERLLRKTDLIRFDGHRPHPLNLAIVLLHDSVGRRVQLAAHALVAFPHWKRRVGLRTNPRRPKSTERAIAVLVTSDRRRGAEVFGERLAHELSRRGWEASLLALSTGDSGPRVDALGVANPSSEQLGRLDPRVILGLRRKLVELRPSIVLANGSSTLQYALVATRLVPHPVKVIYSSIGEPMYWIRGRSRRLAQRLLLSQADLVLAVSENTRRQLVENVGISGASVALAPTGVPHSFFEIPFASNGEEPVRLLFLGNLSREKNPLLALEVARRVSTEVPIELRFVGEGPLQEALQNRVASLGLEKTISLAGPADDVSRHLEWADILLLTSETEGLPGVVLEAAAAAVPAIAFDVGGTAETMERGLTGELISAGDVESFISTVVDLARNETRRVEMGVRARQLAADRYSLERAVDRFEAILNRMTSKRVHATTARGR